MFPWLNENWHKVGIIILLAKEYKIIVSLWQYIVKAYNILFDKENVEKLVERVFTDKEKDQIIASLLSTKEGRELIVNKAKETKTLNKLKKAIKDV